MSFTSAGQNGAVARQTVKIAVSGCTKTKKKARTKEHKQVAKGKKGSAKGQ